MLRKTNYGTWVDDDGNLNDNEKAMLYIKDCAESVGITVDENTPFDIQFMAKIMQKLKEG